MNTRGINNVQNKSYSQRAKEAVEKTSDMESVSNTNSSSAKPGSMMAKANMVKEFNERNNKDK